MKKTLAFFLALLIGVSSLTVCLARELYFQGHNVQFTLTEETGDRKYLEGVSADITFSHLEELFWDTCFLPFGESKTQVSFSKLPRYDDSISYSGLNEYYFNINEITGESEALEKYVSDVKKTVVKNGDKAVIDVVMKDYFDYYPLKINLHLPEISISYYSPVSPYEEGGYTFYGISKERGTGFIKKIKEFIKIPVYENDIRKETIEKIQHGFSYSMEHMNTYSFNFRNAVFPDVLYFTVNNRTDGSEKADSAKVDTSEIEGGYGIYAVPYSENDIKYEEMKTVYPINENSTVIFLDSDTEKNLLYLCLQENGSFVFKVIDVPSFKEISSLSLFSFNREEDYVGYEKFDGFFLFHKNDFELKVVTENPDGTYTDALYCEIPVENEIGWEYFPYDNTAVFDGERLILFVPEVNKYNDRLRTSPCFEIIVFTTEGAVYRGSWENSLGDTVFNSYEAFVRIKDYKLYLK